MAWTAAGHLLKGWGSVAALTSPSDSLLLATFLERVKGIFARFAVLPWTRMHPS